MNNDNAGGLLANPLPIVMVVLLAAGVLIKQVPLQSARPSDPERVKFVPVAQQDVEARLWQDPFAAVEKHAGRSVPTKHNPKELRDRIQKLDHAGGRVKVIAASVSGGSYSEEAESRRRTRFAVLSALGFHGYSPANPDAIGYFRIKLPGGNQDDSWPDFGNAGLDFNLIGPAGSGMLAELVRRTSEPDSVDLTVPYEWFERHKSSSNELSEPSDVLLLWLNEDKLTTGPRKKLLSLILQLTPPRASGQLKTLNGTKRIPAEPLTRISHNGIISRAASPENTFTSMIRGDQHYCHDDRQAIGRRLQRFGFARADSPIRRRSYSLVADSADNPQISAA